MISEAEQGEYITQTVEKALANHPAKQIIKAVAVAGWMEGKKLAKEDGIPEEEAWESFKEEVLHKIPRPE